MLVLSRKLGEEIVIEDPQGVLYGQHGSITLTVVDIDRGKIRLGFVANRAVAINRKEVWERINAPTPKEESTDGSKATVDATD